MSFEKPNGVIGAYVPALHRGYVDLFNRYPEAIVGVFDESITSNLPYLKKDIRALPPEVAVEAIQGIGHRATLLGASALQDYFLRPDTRIILPLDDVSREITSRFSHEPSRIVHEPIFLRWDRDNTVVNQVITPDRIIAAEGINPSVVEVLGDELGKSTNWWRHVSSLITKNDEILSVTHNQSLPTDYSLHIDSDPRITSQRGKNIELSIDIHAESKAIAEMARSGVALEGAEMYVSTFPCPNCAKMIAMSGIKACYFVEGYAMLDGFSVLKDAGVEIVKVETELPDHSSSVAIKYEKTSRS